MRYNMMFDCVLLMVCLIVNIASRPAYAFTFIKYSQSLPTKINHNTRSMHLTSLSAGGKGDDPILEAENDAAFDAHDLSDAGMEAAAMERAVMMAEEYKHNHPKIEKHEHEFDKSQLESCDDTDSLLDAEDAAAFDAHDLSDAGMEAAAMERAVMMAEEMKNKRQ